MTWVFIVAYDIWNLDVYKRQVPAIAFQHIPPQEFYDCLREVPAYTPNAVEGARTFAGHCYVLDRDVCRPGSRLGEAIGCADENVGEVQASVSYTHLLASTSQALQLQEPKPAEISARNG